MYCMVLLCHVIRFDYFKHPITNTVATPPIKKVSFWKKPAEPITVERTRWLHSCTSDCTALLSPTNWPNKPATAAMNRERCDSGRKTKTNLEKVNASAAHHTRQSAVCGCWDMTRNSVYWHIYCLHLMSPSWWSTGFSRDGVTESYKRVEGTILPLNITKLTQTCPRFNTRIKLSCWIALVHLLHSSLAFGTM